MSELAARRLLSRILRIASPLNKGDPALGIYSWEYIPTLGQSPYLRFDRIAITLILVSFYVLTLSTRAQLESFYKT